MEQVVDGGNGSLECLPAMQAGQSVFELVGDSMSMPVTAPDLWALSTVLWLRWQARMCHRSCVSGAVAAVCADRGAGMLGSVRPLSAAAQLSPTVAVNSVEPAPELNTMSLPLMLTSTPCFTESVRTERRLERSAGT